MTTTWASPPINHPWFKRPSLKRRLATYGDLPRSPSPPETRAKRRRYDSLEHGFADLTLMEQQQTLSPPARPLHSPINAISITPPAEVVAPQPIQDVRMSVSSWYEPEKDRIVVTSLDDSDWEPDEPESVSDVTISPILLDQMKKRITTTHIPSRPPPECQALVLYRPIIPNLGSTKSDEKPNQDISPPPVLVDDDAMDVEP